MLGHTLLLIFIILAVLIIFSSPDLVKTPQIVAITSQDETYVEIVRTFLIDKQRIQHEATLIKENAIRPHTGLVLGSSTGELVHELITRGMYTTGLDESPYMVRHAKETFKDTYLQGKYTSALLYQEHSLSHVICFNYTFGFIRDKAAVFRSVHQWLELGGLFFIHVPTEWNPVHTPKYTATKIHTTLREKAILDKTYTINREVYWESSEKLIRLASQYGFEHHSTVSLPFPYTYTVLILKSVDPVYL